MKIKLNTSISGPDGCFNSGDIVDFPGAYAIRLIDKGMASAVEVKKPARAQKAVAASDREKRASEAGDLKD